MWPFRICRLIRSLVTDAGDASPSTTTSKARTLRPNIQSSPAKFACEFQSIPSFKSRAILNIITELFSVMPTAEPSTGLVRDGRESPFGISSSIEENSNDSDGNAIKQFRDKRFFNWNAFATGVTVTSWSIVSSTFTSTLAIPGVSTVPPCLPAGYGVCQIAVGK